MTGSGTKTDPFIIMDVDDLYAMKSIGGDTACFRLGADIDFNGTPYAEHYVPVTFNCAEFDGDGHAIRSIYYSDPKSDISVFRIILNNYDYVVNIKNLTVENIQIVGENVHLFGKGSEMSGVVRLYGCTFLLGIKRTSSSEQFRLNPCLMQDGSNFYVEAELCTISITGELAAPYPVFDGAKSINRTHVHLDIQYQNASAASDGATGIFKNSYITDSYLTGSLSCTNSDPSNKYIVVSNSSVHFSNSYCALSLADFPAVVFNGISDTPSFYDNELTGDAEIIQNVSSLFYGLTTARCKDAGYLKSIGFICGGDE